MLVVEHDAETIRAADHVIDVGPGGGHDGGRIVAQGTPRAAAARSALGHRPLARAPGRAARTQRRPVDAQRGVELLGAREHNLKDVDLRVPLGALRRGHRRERLGQEHAGARRAAARGARALGLADRARRARIDGAARRAALASARSRSTRAPIGRTPRSVPATYVGVWDEIRKLLAPTPEARARGYDGRRASRSTSARAAAPRAKGRARRASRCRSCPTRSSPARPATACASTPRRSPCACTA